MRELRTATDDTEARRDWGRTLCWFVLAGLLCVAAYARYAGLYRGLSASVQFHPDAPKQVVALGHYLQNEYIWYTGKRAIDCYPLFLNHVDEWIVRGARAIGRAWSHLTAWDPPRSAMATMDRLYAWTLTLRALYGVVIVALGYVMARRLGCARPCALLATALLAIAPVSLAVAHFATGDIACDLFFAILIGVLIGHARRPHPAWWGLAGIVLGFAFAGKYNGALIADVIGFYLLLWMWYQPHRWRDAILGGILVGAGAGAGVLVAMPQFAFATRRTLHDLGRILEFIRIYGVTEEFRRLPLAQRLWICLSTNGPRVVAVLGRVCVSAALAGLVLAARRTWRVRRELPEYPRTARNTALLRVAVFLSPFPILLISLLGKPRLHPFQFSYLQLPLYLGAAYAVQTLWRGRARWARALAVLLLAGMLAEAGLQARTELFFWRRDDIEQTSNAVLRHRLFPGARLMKHRHVKDPDKVVRELVLEPDGVSHFRNRPRRLVARDAPFWRALRAAPVPTIPFPGETHWLFMNGPGLPRSDRTLHVSPGRATRRHLVYFARPASVTLGLRCGDVAARVHLGVGGQHRVLELGSDEQVVLDLVPRAWRTQRDPDGTGRDIFLVPVMLTVEAGEAWATFPASVTEAAVYRLFGGGEWDDAFPLPADSAATLLAGQVDSLPYLEGGEGPWAEAGSDVPLWGGQPLAAGLYRLELDLEGAGSGRVELALTDRRRYSDFLATSTGFEVAAGRQGLTYRFAKTFAPHLCGARVKVLAGRCRVTGWRLRPDATAILAAVKAWRAGGQRPAWLARYPAALPEIDLAPIGARFGSLVELEGAALPERLARGAALPVRARVDLLNRPYRLSEYDLFLHLRDAGDVMRHVIHFPLNERVCGEARPAPLALPMPADLAPGRYRVLAGVWNRRVQQNVKLRKARPGSAPRVGDELVEVGHVEIVVPD